MKYKYIYETLSGGNGIKSMNDLFTAIHFHNEFSKQVNIKYASVVNENDEEVYIPRSVL